MNGDTGHKHPLSHVIRRAVDVFSELGFAVAEGPEMETEHYNFDMLNVPKEHPARDMQDTLWLKNGNLLRTQTSPVQIRYMETHTPPVRIIVPGKVFRAEATDATHEAQFFQLEGLAIDTDITLAHLKGTIEAFLKKLFGKEDLKTRFRPSFFPFVEPGVEIDMSCFKCDQKGCNVCKQSGWIEFMGAGMVHPNVLRNGGIDPEKYTGFAFGMGLERLSMLKYGIDDIRLFYGGDLRFINQF